MSVEAQSTQLILPIRLSGPKSFKMLSSSESVPLPEMGRSITIGIISDGIFRKSVSGLIRLKIRSSAPDALKSETAIIRPISVGVIDKTVLSPS